MTEQIFEHNYHVFMGVFLAALLLVVLVMLKVFFAYCWRSWMRSPDFRESVESPKYRMLEGEGLDDARP